MASALASLGYAMLPGTVRAAANPPLSTTHRRLLDTVADTMIPATNTAGARGAGVPAFIEELLIHWAQPETRAQVTTALDQIDAYAVEHAGGSMQMLDPERRTELLAQLDRLRVGDKLGPYRKLKGLILFGYYSSEAGAAKELRYDLVPGSWHGCMPLTSDVRSSAVLMNGTYTAPNGIGNVG